MNEAKVLRTFHNRVKNDLIQRAVMKAGNARDMLDIGVGRGGDIMKWYKHGIHTVIGLDIENAYIREAIRRYNALRVKNDTQYKFHVINNNDSFIDTLKKKDVFQLFDIVSCQFCLHYFASSEELLHETLSNISKVLRPGGVFIGTVPDGKRIHDTFGDSDTFQNSQILIKKKYDTPFGYGDAIEFTMSGTLYFGENMMSHEYLVFFDKVVNIASKYSLELVEWKSFREHFEAHPQIMRMSNDTRNASFLNSTFMFIRQDISDP